MKFPLFMKTTAILCALCTGVFAVLYRISQLPWCLSTAISFGVTAYHFGMRLLVGYAVLKITGYRFDYRKSWFQQRSWEPKLYHALHLRRWKKHIPTYDPKFYDLSQNSLHQVVCNTCGAEIVHEIIMVLSFLPLLLVPKLGELGVFLTTSLISAFVDSIFVLAQRYNRPRLVRILKKQEAKTP